MKIQLKQTSSRWLVLSGLLSACLLVGCKSSINTTSSEAAITKTEEAFFASVLDRSFHFDTFSSRMNLDFSGLQQEFSSRVQVKMICNDRIQLSIQPFLGIEMFRIELSNDSIKILDRMNKRYVIDNYLPLKKEMEMDITFQNIQALLTNQLFIPGENSISNQHYPQFRITKKSSQLAELQLKGRKGTFYTFIADKNEHILSTRIDNEPQKLQLVWEYTQFQMIDNQPFPMKMTARMMSGEQLQGTTTLTFTSPAINNALSLDFIIPSGYRRVSMEQIINSLLTK